MPCLKVSIMPGTRLRSWPKPNRFVINYRSVKLPWDYDDNDYVFHCKGQDGHSVKPIKYNIAFQNRSRPKGNQSISWSSRPKVIFIVKDGFRLANFVIICLGAKNKTGIKIRLKALLFQQYRRIDNIIENISLKAQENYFISRITR